MTSWPTKQISDSGAKPEALSSQVTLPGSAQRNGVKGLAQGDLVYLGCLAVAGLGIWVWDTAWLSAPEETLAILAVVPLFVWLGAPWRIRLASGPLPLGPLVGAALLATAGLVLDTTILLAAAWTFALWVWLKNRVSADATLLRRLAILPVMAFPWVALDLTPVGWWFRLSAAWVVDHAYGAMGFSVLREGTNLLVRNIPIDVAAPCSGLNSLQAILMGGLVLTWMEFGRSRAYWWIVASLPLLAWVVNTVRVCSVVALAVGLGPEAANGSLHQLGGWAVVLVVFGAWWGTARWIAGARPAKRTAA